MANVGEAQITRLTRERLAAIKKFLLVRDAFRDNLQAPQQQKVDFSEQLFKPITTATEEVVTAIEGSKPEVEPPVVKKTFDEKVREQWNRFTEGFLVVIDKADPKALIDFTAASFSERHKYLQPGQNKSWIGSFDKWVDVVYIIKAGISEINRIEDDKYATFDAAVKIKDDEK